MGVDYACEKFFSALHYAVASTTSLQRRLEDVISGVGDLDRDSFPDDETWERFERLVKETTRIPRRNEGEGAIRATTAQMTGDEAAGCLREALGIFSNLAKAYGKERT